MLVVVFSVAGVLLGSVSVAFSASGVFWWLYFGCVLILVALLFRACGVLVVVL